MEGRQGRGEAALGAYIRLFDAHQRERIHTAFQRRTIPEFFCPSPLGMVLAHPADAETDLAVGIDH